jgi:hypothetical protein
VPRLTLFLPVRAAGYHVVITGIFGTGPVATRPKCNIEITMDDRSAINEFKGTWGHSSISRVVVEFEWLVLVADLTGLIGLLLDSVCATAVAGNDMLDPLDRDPRSEHRLE